MSTVNPQALIGVNLARSAFQTIKYSSEQARIHQGGHYNTIQNLGMRPLDFNQIITALRSNTPSALEIFKMADLAIEYQITSTILQIYW